MISSNSRWVQFPGITTDANLRLFCFPYAGSGASLFSSWPCILPKHIDICAIQLPGREGRLDEEAVTHFSALIPALAEALRPYFDRPYAFFGHSLGGLLAFECARYLHQQYDEAPAHLFVSAVRAPHLSWRRSPLYELTDEKLSLTLLRQYSGFAPEVLQEPELMQFFLPILRADLALFESYHYHEQAPLSCPLTACGGWQDATVSYYDLLPWRQHTSSQFALRMFAGDHFFLQGMRSQLLQTLAKTLSAQPLSCGKQS